MYKFEVYQKVLCRSTEGCVWLPKFFWTHCYEGNFRYKMLDGTFYNYCIPYEGNEHLMGTAEDPVNHSGVCNKQTIAIQSTDKHGLDISKCLAIEIDNCRCINIYGVRNEQET